MANLQESARQLVEQIGELDTDAAGATSTLSRLRDRLKAAEKELDDRIEELENEVDEFVGRVAEQTSGLSGELDEADQAMTQAQQAVEGASAAAASAIDAGRQAAQGLADAIGALPESVEAVVAAQAEGTASRLGEQARAASAAVEQALDLTSDNVRRLTDSLVELQQQIPAAADGTGQAIKKADEHLGKAFVTWTSRLFEVVDLVKNEGFEPAQENAEQVADFAMEQCRHAVEGVLQPAFDRMAELARDFEALEQAIGQSAEQVTAEGEPLVSELGELRSAITAADGWLETVEEWLGSYTFVKG